MAADDSSFSKTKSPVGDGSDSFGGDGCAVDCVFLPLALVLPFSEPSYRWMVCDCRFRPSGRVYARFAL